MHHFPVIVIGGGQSGLSVSYCLKQAGVEHVVLEKHCVAHTWRTQRWDTFCLVTPNWQCKLPGYDYAADFGGQEPNGFMLRDDIVRYVQSYADSFDAPLREGVSVTRVTRSDAGYALETTAGPMTADQVVVAVGGYHRPTIPAVAERLPAGIVQLHSSHYRNAGQLPPGGVLVIGTGQSGCQIAEDLHLAGRETHLCVGGAPRVARRYRGRDVVDWLADMGYYDLPVDKHPLKEDVRTRANHYVTGRDGGRDIDLRQRAVEGMRLYGRLDTVDGTLLTFKPDLAANLDKADLVSESIKTSIDNHITAAGLSAPAEDRYRAVWRPESDPASLDLTAAGVTSIVWCIGFKSDFSWIEVPVFTGRGYPGHKRGVTGAPGLYFVGLPWLYTWGSGRFSGIARDAGHVVDHIVSLRRPASASSVASWDDAGTFSELAFGS